jgi:hypothetical protein
VIFKLQLIVISFLSAVISWHAEKHVFTWVARFAGQLKRAIGVTKIRKRYKVLRDGLLQNV